MFNPEGFLNVCNHAITNEGCQSEEFYRTVIGRAYYAAFLVAREKLISLGDLKENELKKRSIHWLVINKYGLRRESTIKSQLTSLKKERQKADYNLENTINFIKARNCLELSNRIIDKVNRIES